MNSKGFEVSDIGFLFAGLIIMIIYMTMYGPLTDILFPLLENADNMPYGDLVKLIVQLFPVVLAAIFIIKPFMPRSGIQQYQ